MAETTENLGLKKPYPEDFYDVQDWNGNSDIIDEWAGEVNKKLKGTSSLTLGETSDTAYRGDRGKAAYDHAQIKTGNPHNVTKSDVGLGNANNTADLDKPVSNATQTELDKKLNLVGGTMTGDLILNREPVEPMQAATKNYVDGLALDPEDFVKKAGDTMTGPLTLPGDPTSELHAATKQYIDAINEKLTKAINALEVLKPINQQTIALNTSFEDSEITDSWDEIIASVNDGSYGTKYKIGQYKPLDLGTEGIVNMQLVAKVHDEMPYGGGYKAPTTWIAKELLKTGHTYTGIYDYLNTTIMNLLPENLRSELKYTPRSTLTTGFGVVSVSTICRLWLPTRSTLDGTDYPSVYNSDKASRIKHKVGSSTAEKWWPWCGEEPKSSSLYVVNEEGAISGYRDSSSSEVGNSVSTSDVYGVCIGFCI